jgi:hypothetical protein
MLAGAVVRNKKTVIWVVAIVGAAVGVSMLVGYLLVSFYAGYFNRMMQDTGGADSTYVGPPALGPYLSQVGAGSTRSSTYATFELKGISFPSAVAEFKKFGATGWKVVDKVRGEYGEILLTKPDGSVKLDLYRRRTPGVVVLNQIRRTPGTLGRAPS